jgi:hypothetical protein
VGNTGEARGQREGRGVHGAHRARGRRIGLGHVLLAFGVLLISGIAVLFLLGGGDAEAPSKRILAGAPEARPPRSEKPEAVADIASAIDPEAGDPAPPVARVRHIAGRIVRLSDGTPLPGALVTTELALLKGPAPDGDAFASGHVARTREPDGVFELTDELGTVRQLHVLLDDDWPRLPSAFALPDPPSDVSGVTFTLDSGFIIGGVVRDLRGVPVPDVIVSAGVVQGAKTDASGRYVLRDVAPWPGVRALECSAHRSQYERQIRPITVPAHSSQLVTADFELTGHGAIAGTITDAAGQPVAEVDVWLPPRFEPWIEAPPDAPLHCAVTDAEGHYRIEQVSEGAHTVLVGAGSDPWRVLARTLEFDHIDDQLASAYRWDDTGFAQAVFHGVPVEAGSTTPLDAVLAAGITLQGRVTDAEGKPLEDIHVHCFDFAASDELDLWANQDPWRFWSELRRKLDEDQDALSAASARTRGTWSEWRDVSGWREWTADITDADGRYTISRMAPGPKHLQAGDSLIMRGCATQWMDITLEASEPVKTVDFVLTQPVMLGGRVTDPAGEPIGQAHITTGSPRRWDWWSGVHGHGSTRDNGAFLVHGASPGTQAIWFHAEGFQPLQDTITAGEPERTFVMEPSIALHGLLTDAMTGERVTDFEVLVRGAGESDWCEAGFDNQGHFLLERNSDEPCDVTVTAPGYLRQTFAGAIPSTTRFGAALVLPLQPKPGD